MTPLVRLADGRYRALTTDERVLLAMVEDLGPDGGVLDLGAVAARLPDRPRPLPRRPGPLSVVALLGWMDRLGLVRYVAGHWTLTPTVVATARPGGGDRHRGEVTA